MAKFFTNDKMTIDVDDASGVPRSMEEYVDTIDGVGKEFETLEITSFGSSGVDQLVGRPQAVQITIQGHYDNTASVGPDAVLKGILGGAPGTVTIKPDGTKQLSGEFLCTQYDYRLDAGSLIRFSASFESTGPVTLS